MRLVADICRYRSSDKVAVCYKSIRYTYRELIYAAQKLAEDWTIQFQIKKGDIVVLSVCRCYYQIVCIVSILFSCAIYCPVHPSDSSSKKESIRARCSPLMWISDKESDIYATINLSIIADRIESFSTQSNIILPYVMSQDDDCLLYITHTSGTTGEPKGIQIREDGFIEMIKHIQEDPIRYRLSGINLQMASCTFDVHFLEIFGTLREEGCLIVMDETLYKDPYYIYDLIQSHHVSSIDTIPTMISRLKEVCLQKGKELYSIRQFIIGGEESIPRHVIDIREICPCLDRVINMYGPSECSVNCIGWSLITTDCVPSRIPIGSCIKGYDYKLINNELYISGKGVMTSYTEERLNKNVFITVDNQRYYKTGDLISIYDNVMYYDGRVDTQVKIRGQRIELEEIDRCIRLFRQECFKVLDSITIVDDPKLLTFLRLEEETLITERDLRQYCMIASVSGLCFDECYIVFEYPLTINGKINRNELKINEQYRRKRLSVSEEIDPDSMKDEIYIFCSWLRRQYPSKHIEWTHDLISDVGFSSYELMDLLVQLNQTYNISFFDLYSHSSIVSLFNLLQSCPRQVNSPTDITRCVKILSVLQEALLTDQLIVSSHPIYNIGWKYILVHPHELDRIVVILGQIFNVHSVLRQILNDDFSIDFKNKLVEIEQVEYYDHIYDDLLSSVIRLDQSSYRLFVVTKEGVANEIFIVFHHSVFDGHSCTLLSKYISDMLSGKSLVPMSLSYYDWAFQEKTYLETEQYKTELEWWTQLLFPYTDYVTTLPLDRPLLMSRLYADNEKSFDICSSIGHRLSLFAKVSRVSVYLVCLVLINSLIAKLSDQDCSLVGTICFNRDRMPYATELIGYFANIVCYPLDHICGYSLRDLIQRYKDVFFKYSWIPFTKVINELDIDRTRQSTVPSCFQVYSTFLRKSEEVEWKEPNRYYLTFSFIENTKLILRYISALFDEETISLLVEKWNMLIEQSDLDRCPLEACLMTFREESILYSIHHISEPLHPKGIRERLISYAEIDDRTSMIYRGKCLSYRQLLGLVRYHSLKVRKSYPSLQPGDTIIQVLERGFEVGVSMFTILWLGCKICPIHYEEPVKRVETMLSNLSPGLCIYHVHTIDKIACYVINCPTYCITAEVNVDEYTIMPVTEEPMDILAGVFVLHTSGSTGVPKAILLSEDSILNFSDHLDLDANDRFLQLTKCTFDVYMMETLCVWINGSSCVMLEEQYKNDFRYVNNVMMDAQITRAFMVPSYATLFYKSLEYTEYSRFLRHLYLGGEAVLPELISQIWQVASNLRIYSCYAPAECTVVALQHEYNKSSMTTHMLGVPIKNVQCHIFDSAYQEKMIGMEGELFISGKGLMVGYVNRLDLTQECFQTIQGIRYYRSGDWVRRLKDGSIQILSRKDRQIKLRGQRIEIFEIEKIIQRHSCISQCTVLKATESDTLIAFYCETTEYSLSKKEIESHCREYLPGYMVPSQFVCLREFPLNRNGKVDYLMLQELARSIRTTSRSKEEQITYMPREVEFLEKVEDITGVSPILFSMSLQDDLVMTSLMMIRLLTVLRHDYRCRTLTFDRLLSCASVQEVYYLTIRIDQDANVEYAGDFISFSTNGVQHRANQLIVPLLIDQEYSVDTKDKYKENWLFEIIHDSGELTSLSLEYACKKIIERHSVLRSSFVYDSLSREYIQKVHSIENMVIRCNTIEGSEEEINIALREQKERRLSLQTPPLLYFTLFVVHIGEKILKYILQETHHIVFDHYCVRLYREELDRYIREYYRGKLLRYEPLSYQYIDISFAETSSTCLSEGLEFWNKTLLVEHAYKEYISTRPCSKNSSRGTRIVETLSKEMLMSIRQICNTYRMTFHMCIQTILGFLLSELTNEYSLYIGTIQSMRQTPVLCDMIGYFLNPLPSRWDYPEDTYSISELWTKNRKHLLNTIKYNVCPYSTIMSECHIPTRGDRLPYFCVSTTEVPTLMFDSMSISDTVIRYTEFSLQHTQCELSFMIYMYHTSQGGHLDFEFCIDMYEEEVICQLKKRYMCVLYQLLSGSFSQVHELSILLPDEQQIYYEL